MMCNFHGDFWLGHVVLQYLSINENSTVLLVAQDSERGELIRRNPELVTGARTRCEPLRALHRETRRNLCHLVSDGSDILCRRQCLEDARTLCWLKLKEVTVLVGKVR